jgi:threonine/homoserine/homoserine lactone efflux protein
MTIALTSQFVTAGNGTTVVPIIAAVFVVMGAGSASLWAAIGTSLARWLKVGNRLQWYNRTMALLIVAGIALLFLE